MGDGWPDIHGVIRERRDRRRWERRELAAPCKVLHEASGRYLHGVTRNVSDGGVLLTLAEGRPLLPGEPVLVGVAIEGKPLLGSEAMRRALVVWADLAGESQRVAVEFDPAPPP